MNNNIKIINLSKPISKNNINNSTNNTNNNNSINKIITELNKYVKNKYIEDHLLNFFTNKNDYEFVYKNFIIKLFIITTNNTNKNKEIGLVIKSKYTDNNHLLFLITLKNLDTELRGVRFEERINKTEKYEKMLNTYKKLLKKYNKTKNNKYIKIIKKQYLKYFFDAKKAIYLGIDICKRLGIKRIKLTDESFFYCTGTDIIHHVNMPNIHLLQKRKGWYNNHFGFELSDNKVKERNNILNKLKFITIKDIKNINNIQNFINANNISNNEKKKLNDIFLFTYFNYKKFTKKQCDILAKSKFIKNILTKYGLKSSKDKVYKLKLENWEYLYI
jgi:hypothetical protein